MPTPTKGLGGEDVNMKIKNIQLQQKTILLSITKMQKIYNNRKKRT